MKFLCICLSPAIDATVRMDAWPTDGCIIKNAVDTFAPGGKTVNVARWLAKRGATVACGGLLGEDNAAMFEKELEKYGIDAEVIDLRAVNPLNYDKLVESVKKTGKVVMVNEAVERGNVMQNVAATLSQLAFDYLDAPIAVVGSRNWVSPAAELESKFFPQVSWILDTINERIMPLKGYAPSINRSLGELARTSRQGV